MLKNMIKRIGNLATEDLQEILAPKLEDAIAFQQLPDLGIGFLPWSSFALRPSAVKMILNEISLNDGRVILECGIGISTLYALHDSSDSGVKLIGIENDIEWLEITRTYLERMCVDSCHYKLLHAPLADIEIDGLKYNWYDISPLSGEITSFLGDQSVDLILVDGPCGALCNEARYPALIALQEYLSDDYAVFLDDIHRTDEDKIARRWAEQYDLSLRYHRHVGDMAILRPKTTRKVRTIM